MSLTPKEEAMRIEVRSLIELKPSDPEAMYVYSLALTMFFEQYSKEILDILDLHFKHKMKG